MQHTPDQVSVSIHHSYNIDPNEMDTPIEPYGTDRERYDFLDEDDDCTPGFEGLNAFLDLEL